MGVTKTERCSFTEFRIGPGRGRRFIAKDGRVHHIWGSKARCMFHRKIKPVKLTWTLAWRAFNKKIKVDDTHKRRTKKTARVQKAVVGMSLDEVKERKQKALKEKKDKKAKEAGKGGKKQADKAAKPAPAGGKKNVAVKR